MKVGAEVSRGRSSRWSNDHPGADGETRLQGEGLNGREVE
jgi:hypothetical protein